MLPDAYFDTPDIRAITLYTRDSDSSARRFVVSTAVGNDDIRHSGPGVWNLSKALFRLNNSETVKLSEIETLFLANSVPDAVCE
jgi:hypothetical protein